MMNLSDCDFIIQDPSDPKTVYLYEALLCEAWEACEWKAMFAFSTKNGVDMLFADPIVESFIKKYTMELIVGIDAVTNDQCLTFLMDIQDNNPNLNVKVFITEIGAIFHPKVSLFSYKNGDKSVVVGSGNLTPGGMAGNFEAFSVIRSKGNTLIKTWDEFVNRHVEHLVPITQSIIDLAAKNKPFNIRRSKRQINKKVAEEFDLSQQTYDTSSDKYNKRILIAEVPKAGGRTQQVHFNSEIIKKFFLVKEDSPERAFLNLIDKNRVRYPTEARPCIYSNINKNYKIEMRGLSNIKYPQEPYRPIIIVREIQVRSFDYTVVLPDDGIYSDIHKFLRSEESIGRGLHRIITDSIKLKQIWRDCPLFYG